MAKYQRVYQGIRVQPLSAIIYYAVFAVRRYSLIVINIYFSQGSPLSDADRTQYLMKISAFLIVQLF